MSFDVVLPKDVSSEPSTASASSVPSPQVVSKQPVDTPTNLRHQSGAAIAAPKSSSLSLQSPTSWTNVESLNDLSATSSNLQPTPPLRVLRMLPPRKPQPSIKIATRGRATKRPTPATLPRSRGVEALSSNNEPIEDSSPLSSHVDHEYEPQCNYQSSTFSTSDSASISNTPSLDQSNAINHTQALPAPLNPCGEIQSNAQLAHTSSFRDRLRAPKRRIVTGPPLMPRRTRQKISQIVSSLPINPLSEKGGGACKPLSATEPCGTGDVADTSSSQITLVQSATRFTEVTSAWDHGGVHHLTTICGTVESRDLICALRSQLLTRDGCVNAEVMSSCPWEPLFGLIIETERDGLINFNRSARAFINLSDISSRLPNVSQTLSGNDNRCDYVHAI